MKLQSDRSVQSDIIYFKEDVLRTLKMLESKLNTKLESSSSLVNETLQSYNTQLNSFQNKIDDLSTLISTDKETTYEEEDQIDDVVEKVLQSENIVKKDMVANSKQKLKSGFI